MTFYGFFELLHTSSRKLVYTSRIERTPDWYLIATVSSYQCRFVVEYVVNLHAVIPASKSQYLRDVKIVTKE